MHPRPSASTYGSKLGLSHTRSYNPSMRGIDSTRVSSGVSACQMGMFTSTQAKRLGVGRYAPSRLEKGGSIERALRGVYRMEALPAYARRMPMRSGSLVPDREPGTPDASGRTPRAHGRNRHLAAGAAGAREIGSAPLEFCCEVRRQTQRGNLSPFAGAHSETAASPSLAEFLRRFPRGRFSTSSMGGGSESRVERAEGCARSLPHPPTWKSWQTRSMEDGVGHVGPGGGRWR